MGKTSVGGAVIQLTLFCFSSDIMHCFVMVLFRHVFLAISCVLQRTRHGSSRCLVTLFLTRAISLCSHLAFWSFPQLKPPQLTCGVACEQQRKSTQFR